MSLSSYNVTQQLTNQLKQFILLPHSFSSLKSYLVSKQSIFSVHQKLFEEINAIKNNDKTLAQAAIEHSISKRQIEQDNVEKAKDIREEDYQELEKIPLSNERIVKTTALMQLQAEITTLQIIIAKKVPTHTHEHPSTVTSETVHTHPSTAIQLPSSNSHNHSTTVAPVHTHPSTIVLPDPNELRAMELQRMLHLTTLRIQEIDARFIRMQQQSYRRHINRTEREARLQARLDLEQNKYGVTLFDTLTVSNGNSLKNDLLASTQALELKAKTLIAEAERLNYPTFMHQLELSLSNLKLTSAEIEALRDVIMLMKKHFEQVTKANSTQAELTKTTHNLSSSQSRLQQHFARVGLLTQANPNLTKQNEELTAKNLALAVSQQENLKARDKFITPTWILASVALITAIPLFLTMGGVIPIILAPIMLYTLVSIIPSLALLAGIGTGVTTLVFAIKERLNHYEMQANTKTIGLNKEQMKANDQEKTELEIQTIPSCQKEIQENTKKKEQLEDTLQKTQLLADQIVQQATATEPLVYHPIYPVLPKVEVTESAPPLYPTSTAYGFFQAPPPYAPPLYPIIEPSAPPMSEFDKPSNAFH